MNGIAAKSEPDREAPIDKALSELQGETYRVGELLAVLHDRLTPILGPVPTEKMLEGNNNPYPGGSSIAVRATDVTVQLRGYQTRIHDILEALEV